MDHLDKLEAEAIYIMREVAAECEKPVMLYSIGKDSSVMLHLALKAFYPEKPPFPFLHVNTTWKFKEMIDFRDRIAEKYGIEMLEYINEEGIAQGINPFDHGAAYTDIMKTQALKQALNKYGFTAAFGGGRRDEEKSRAKERIFSFRNCDHAWDPKNQRPEMWKLYNTQINKGESIRVFPLSNWTEKDIWMYIQRERIDIVPLYFAAIRPVVERDGNLIMVDDERMRLLPNEKPVMKKVRFRTLGCYPLSGGMESDADTLDAIIEETLSAVSSERTSRVIDKDGGSASMEKRKREGYFLIGKQYNEDGSRNRALEKENLKKGMATVYSYFEIYDNIILSEETLWRAFRTHRYLFPYLKKHAKIHGYHIQIIVYLRRQDEYQISLWKQNVKHPKTAQTLSFEERLNEVMTKEPLTLQYADTLDEISNIFGKDSLTVRRYDRSFWKNQSIIDDFLDCIGLSCSDAYIGLSQEINTSLSENMTQIKRIINKESSFSKDENAYLLQFMRNLSPESEKQYPCSMLSADETRTFLAQFTEGNDRVVKEYLGDEKPLFSNEIKDLEKWTPDNPYMMEDLIRFFQLSALIFTEKTAACKTN